MFFACCSMLICHSPLNCSSQIINLPSLFSVFHPYLSHSNTHASYLPLQVNIKHIARVLKTYCSVGGIGPPCLYSHRLCSRNSMLNSFIGVTFVWILLGFKSMTFSTAWLIYIILQRSLLLKELLFYIELRTQKVKGIQIFVKNFKT